MKRLFGAPKAQDDIAELHKVKVKDLSEFMLVPEHVPLLQMLKKWLLDHK